MAEQSATNQQDMAERNPNLIQVHVAEYATLTARSTSFITIQSILWPLLLVLLTLAAQIPSDKFDPRLIAWGSVAAVIIIIFGFYGLLIEQYRNIFYIEDTLRPLLEQAVGNTHFWLYESRLAEKRGFEPLWWEFGTLVIPAGAMIVAAWKRYAATWSFWDYVGLLVNVVLLGVITKLAIDAFKLRQSLPFPQLPQ